MDDMKLFANKKKELETMMPRIRIYKQDIGLEFGIEKCAIRIMRNGKRRITEGIELSNQERIKNILRKEKLQILGSRHH